MFAHSTASDRHSTQPIASATMPAYPVIGRAVRYLSDNWQDQPELDALAAHLNMSPAHCQRLFKQWCGLSPKEFVQALTIDHARALLDSSASLLDASLEVGLSGPGRLHDLFVTHEAMTPGEYKRRGEGLEIAYGFHPSPFGFALLMLTERGICGLGFADDEDAREEALADMTSRWPAATFTETPAKTAPFAAQIFNPDKSAEPLRIALIGSAFEMQVWETLLRIPAGRALTYSDVAREVGKPGAMRAVGTAVGRNPVAFVVPCHRVLAKAGKLGGYHWGITRKQAIIGWEKGRLAAV